MTFRALIRHAFDGFVWNLTRPARKPPEHIAALAAQADRARKAHRSTKHIEAAMRKARIQHMKDCQQ